MFIIMTDDGKFVLPRIDPELLNSEKLTGFMLEGIFIDVGNACPKQADRFDTITEARKFVAKLKRIRKNYIIHVTRLGKKYPHMNDLYNRDVKHFQDLTFNIVEVSFTPVK